MLRETWLVFVRAWLPVLRTPWAVAFGAVQPLLHLALFGPLLPSLGQGSWQWFVPGLLVMTALTGTAYAGFALIPEIRSGVLERMRVSPVSRTALLLGRVLKDVVLLLTQAALVAVVALALGFRTSVTGLLLGLGLVALVGIGVGSASHALALRLRHEYLFAPLLSAVVMPLVLLSGVLLPMTLAPAWLATVAAVNPLSHVVTAERAVFAGGTGWPGALVALALAAACTAWGVRTFQRENG
ncbi:ABC transporter permease [Umezawaea beigongshangensis]|uniref:ABC transporter permease n=1 Tax=Umezawaea beigongshangensis TaxID=2780383 RepID=UPI0018F1C5DD|nr:ABC transporter permease [Umezawaea beigongshangensis]